MTKIKKIIAGVTALACAGVLGVGIATEGFTNWTSSTEQSTSIFNGGMIAGDWFGNGMSLSMVKASAAEADTVTVKATLTTAGSGYNDELTWTPAFKSNSTWASGKKVADYVTITPASDTHSITVKCKQAFGTPIVITAASVDDPDVKATCQLDYVKRVESVDIALGRNGLAYCSEQGSAVLDYELGVGTLTPELEIPAVYVNADRFFESSEGFMDLVHEYGDVNGGEAIGGDESDFHLSGSSFIGTVSWDYNGYGFGAPFSNNITDEIARQFNNYIHEHADEFTNILDVEIVVRASYDGTVYQNETFYDMDSFELDTFPYNTVTGVSLDKTTLIF